MKILRTKHDLKEAINKIKNLGFVPTMGSLHNGHISLIKKSKLKCNKTLVSIYVNPKQFNNNKDFSKYPRNINRDLNILKKLKVNFVFVPSTKEIFKEKRIKKIVLPNKDKILCAKFRKGHFEGVLDIMDRFIKLINPKYTFMGEKDFQQLFLIKKFISKKYKNKIYSCKTVRDKNFLALSSRNYLLSKNELKKLNLSEESAFKLIYKDYWLKDSTKDNWKTVFQEVFNINLESFYQSLSSYTNDIDTVLPSENIKLENIFSD